MRGLFDRTGLAFVGAIAAIALLSACASQSKDGNYVGDTDGGSIGVTTIDYNGHPLYCVERGHALTCDWVRYHAENG